jgi:excisionase family DNA binding protein
MNTAITPDQQVFNVAQAATYLQCGPKIIRRLCRSKKLAHEKIDQRGTVRISREALVAYLTGGKAAA